MSFFAKKSQQEAALLSHRLRTALSQPGCPICRLVRESEETWIWTLLYEFSGDPEVHSRLASSLGLCRRHADLMRAVVEQRHLVTPSSVARLYESVIRELEKQLTSRSGKQFKSLTRETCPLCQYAAEAEKREAYFLAKLLRREEWRRLYANSEGLCLHHLELVLSQADRPTRSWLLADTQARLAELLKRLSELQRKQRYDVGEEITPAEASSWREALWRFGGVEYHSLLTKDEP